MNSINVCFSRTNGIVCKIIRWFSRGSVSHALLTFRDETLDKTFVMEANGRGFMLTPWRKWLDGHELVCRFSLSLDEKLQLTALRDLAQFLGSQYDYLSLLGFFFRRWWGRMRNPFDDPKKMICSEAVARFLYTAGLERFQNHETWTPGDLLQEAEQSPVFRLEENADGVIGG